MELESELLRIEVRAKVALIHRDAGRLGEGVVVLATTDKGAIRVAAGVTPALSKRVSAGDLIRSLTQLINGKGGGKPEFAQGGGDDLTALPAALKAVESQVETALQGN